MYKAMGCFAALQDKPDPATSIFCGCTPTTPQERRVVEATFGRAPVEACHGCGESCAVQQCWPSPGPRLAKTCQ